MKLPKDWETITFGDAFEYQSKTGVKAGEGASTGKYKFFTSSSEQTKHIDKFSFEGEHLIFATGGKAGVHYCNEKFGVSNDCFTAKSKRKDIFLKYVYYFFIANMHILERGFRGAGLKHMRSQYLNEVKIPKPPYETQKKIAALLEKAEKLKDYRADADKLTDELLKSVFYEMFGNPATKPRWKVTDLASVCKMITDGTHQPPKFVPSGIPFLFVSNIVKGKIDFSAKNFISEETYEELTRRKPIEVNDILYSTVGSYGVAVLVDTDRKFSFQRHIGHIKPDEKSVNPVFLKILLNTAFVMNQAHKYARGVAQKTINLAEIRKFQIILPPISLQNRFASIVEKIEVIKEKQKQSNIQTNILFNSLIRSAFKGELIA